MKNPDFIILSFTSAALFKGLMFFKLNLLSLGSFGDPRIFLFAFFKSFGILALFTILSLSIFGIFGKEGVFILSATLGSSSPSCPSTY